MRITPITTQNNAQTTNFKSKLPPIDYKYTEGYKDFWQPFADYCMKTGKESTLKKLLTKIKENGDNNLLALTHSKKRETKIFNGISANSDIYTFSLHPEQKESKFIDMDNSHSFVKDVFVKLSDVEYRKDAYKNAFRYEFYSNAINTNCKKNDTIYDRILKIFEAIAETGSETNKMIFGNNISKEELLLKDFRA